MENVDKTLKHLVDVANKAASEGKDDKEKYTKLCSDKDLDVQTVSTGSLAIDNASGVGGIPRGRVIEIYGPEACGKTTVCLGIIANVQRMGGVTSFLDMEHSLDPKLATGCGVDIDKLLLSQPKHGEQCFAIMDALIHTGKLDLIVVDSIAAMVPKAELEGEMEDVQMGAQARMLGKGLRKITGIVSKTKTIVIFINQLREKLGSYGSPEVTPGGRALKFFASMRLDVRRKLPILSESKKIIGNRVIVKFIKNKVAMPHAVAETIIMFGKGIDNSESLVEYGIGYGLISKSGSFFSYKDSPKQNGMENFVKWLKESNNFDPLIDIIQKKIKENAILTIIEPVKDEESEESEPKIEDGD